MRTVADAISPTEWFVTVRERPQAFEKPWGKALVPSTAVRQRSLQSANDVGASVRAAT